MLAETGMLIITLICVSIASGLLSGAFGIGGGIFFVPTIGWLTMYFFPNISNPAITANTTSLSCILVINSLTLWQRRKTLQITWPSLIKLYLCTLIGASFGSWGMRQLDMPVANAVFGSALLGIACIKLFYHANKIESLPLLKRVYPGIIIPISAMASMLGLGGGIFFFPLLLRLSYSKTQTASISTILTLMISSTAMIWAVLKPQPSINSFYFVGDIFWPMLASVGCIGFFFSKIGIQINEKNNPQVLESLLAGLLLCIAIIQLQPLIKTLISI